MIYALKAKKSPADEPRPIPELKPLTEVRLAAANSKQAKNCQLRKLKSEEFRILFTAAFRPFGKREVKFSQADLQWLNTLVFDKPLPFPHGTLNYVELTYTGGDIKNEASYAFTFIPSWCGTHCKILVRCDDFVAAISELTK